MHSLTPVLAESTKGEKTPLSLNGCVRKTFYHFSEITAIEMYIGNDVDATKSSS
jgi:hypothetical protein